jgi:hypothetical protein
MSDDTVGGLSTPEHLDVIGGTPLREAGPRGRRTVVAAVTVLGVVVAGGAAV